MIESEKLVQQGIQYLQSGKLPDAETCFCQVIQTNSEHPDAWHLLGIISAQKKEYSQAIEQIRRAIELKPNEALFYKNLANVYQDKGDIEQAIAAFTRAVELAPQSWDIYYNLGILLGIKNDSASAIKFLETFVKAQPHHIDGHANLGVAYGKQGETEKAIATFEKALALNPNQVNTLNNLGNAYIEHGELEKAILSCQKAIELEPNYAEAHYHLALALQKQDKLTEAVKSYQKALEIKPNYPDALNNLGNVFNSQGRFNEAIKSYQKALEIEPELRNTLYTLGNVFLSQGRTNEVIQSYQGALNIDPQFISARSNYLFTLNYGDSYQPETIYQEHQKWAELYEKPLVEFIPRHSNVPNPEKKIRLGYVSGDFKTHSVAFFLESILANHNHQNFEIICYSNTKQSDRVTGRLKALADGWRQIETMGDQKVAELIQQDKIDILIDLSGHTRDNRLLVFARKPAPIQVTYLGYPNTTGLKNIDYRFTDNYTDSIGETDHLYSETLIRLPHGFLCYTPLSDAPNVSLAPCLTKKYITFGSFNNFAKISPTMIHCWSEIINAIPESKMILKTGYTIDKESQNYWYELLEKSGIERANVELVSKLPAQKQHLAFYENIDIALDTFPYNGTTTTCEALWMGIPVITLAGKTHVSRVGVSLLSSVGLEEFIAQSPEEYVQKAVALANEQQRLQGLRATLRRRMKVAPLTNASLITQSVEDAYRQMWRNWCDTQDSVKVSSQELQSLQITAEKEKEN